MNVCLEESMLPVKGFERQYRTRRDEASGWSCGFSPFLPAAHIHSPGISLLFLPVTMQLPCGHLRCNRWCLGGWSIAVCVCKCVYVFVCAVEQWCLFHYKLVATGRDRGRVECDEGARGALSDSWRSKLPRVSSSLTHISTALTRRWLCSALRCGSVIYTYKITSQHHLYVCLYFKWLTTCKSHDQNDLRKTPGNKDCSQIVNMIPNTNSCV